MGKLFDDIMEASEEALAFMQGKDTGARVHIPHAIDTRRIRAKLEMTQEQFAGAFGFSVDAVRHWEAGRRVPEAAAQSLLRVIDHDAATVRRALAKPAVRTPRRTSRKALTPAPVRGPAKRTTLKSVAARAAA